jgi:hypothetical protein
MGPGARPASPVGGHIETMRRSHVYRLPFPTSRVYTSIEPHSYTDIESRLYPDMVRRDSRWIPVLYPFRVETARGPVVFCARCM